MKNALLTLVTILVVPQLVTAVGYSPDIWLDGSDASTIVLSSGEVQQWSDKSGNGYHAIAPSSANRPAYDSVKGSIEFDGIDDALRIANGSECGPNDEITVFVVAQLDDLSVNRSILTDDNWTTGCRSFAVHYWAVSFAGYMAMYGDGREEHYNQNYDLHLTSFRYDGSILHSGMDGLTPPLQKALSQDTSGIRDLMLGMSLDLARNALDGRICEVIIYKKALTALQVQDVEYQLRNKWGFEMDRTHPFYSDDFGIEFGQTFSIAENAANGTVVGIPVAVSTNTSFSPTNWRIEPVGALDKTVDVGAFDIDPDTGEIFVADSSKLDFEQFTTHRIAVSMTDGTRRSRGVEVDIDVIDVADGDPARTHSSLWGVNGELWDSYSRLPDFSHAGYHWGEDPVPDNSSWPVYNITSYGAVANDGNDDSAEIQAAVNAASTSGAIVYMPAGQFRLESVISINRGNLILRGAGRGAGGTVLYCPVSQDALGRDALNDHIIEFEGNNGNYYTFNSKNVAGEAKRGDRTLLLSSAPSWQPGQKVHLGLTEEGPNLQGSLWLHLHNDQADFNPNPSAWAGGSGTWPYTVERVVGKLVTFREPLRCDVRLVWQPKVFERKGMSEVGAEDFKMEFPVTPVPVHLQEDGYNGIHFKYVEHGWIRRIEFENADNPVAFGRCSNSNMEDLLFTGRAAHHGPSADYDGNNLIRNIVFDQTNSFVHSITFTHKATGNVACDLSGTATIALDLHGNCPMENLFTGVTTAWGDGSSGTEGSQPHGAHGNTYWNLTGSNTFEPSNYKYIGTTIVGPTALPDSHTVTRDWTENITSVSPANLYDAQLARRLNPPADPAFASGAFGERSNWFERDPARWRVSNGAEPAYEIRFGEAPAMPGNRLSTYSIYTNTPETEIEMLVQTLEDFLWQPGADAALVLGYQDDDNYLYASVSAANGAEIVRVQNGTGTQLASDPAILLASNPPSSGSGATSVWKNISFIRSGNTIELTYGSQTLQATDTVFTSGYAGIGSNLGKAAFKESVLGNMAPVADALSTNTLEDVSVDIVLTGSDAEGDSLSFAVETDPVNGSLSGIAPNLTYTPNTNYFGTDSFTFKVNDGTVDSSNATVSITINAVNDAPSADALSTNTLEGVAVDIVLTGSDTEGDSLSFAVETDPAHGMLSGTAPNLTYTPDTSYNGADSFTFTVNDGTADSAPATVSITVNAPVTSTVLELWDFNDDSGTRLYDVTNSGTIGTAWGSANTTWVTDGSGALTLSGAIGNDWKDSVDYSPYLADSGTYSYEMTISAWSHDAAAAGSSLKSKIRNAAGTTMAELQFHFDADKAHATINSGNTNYRNIDLGGLSGGPVTIRVDFNTDTLTSEYFVNGVSQYTFSNLNASVMTNGIKDISLSREGGWSSAAMSLSVDRIKLSLEGISVDVDTDGDGLTDAEEIALGTDPNDPNSGFGIDGMPIPATGKIQITWPSATGVLYRIWESPNLVDWFVARNWAAAATPPEDMLELDLSPSNGFFKVEADIQ